MSDILDKSNILDILKKMHVVFCQCHAYRHTKTDDDRIDIVHFTSAMHEGTNFELQPGRLQCDEILTVADSHHLELEEYARVQEHAGLEDFMSIISSP